MSIDYSANLIYGVRLTDEELERIDKLPNRDEIYENWVHNTDTISRAGGDFIIGFLDWGVSEGRSESIDLEDFQAPDPFSKRFSLLQDVLKSIGVDRKPTWYLTCSIM